MTSEQLLEACVALAGGRRVVEVCPAATEGANADFIFEEENIIAEAKALEKDFASDPDIAAKMQELVNGWMTDGRFVAYGNTLHLQDLPDDCAAEFIQLFRKPFGQRLKKANEQIKRTRERLNRPDALGLLLLSNDGNLTLDPEMTFFLLHHLLKGQMTSIEHVIYVAPHLRSNLAGLHPRTTPFFSVRFPDRRQPSQAFVQRLSAAWKTTLQRFTQEPLVDLGWQSLDSGKLGSARFSPAEGNSGPA